MTEVASVGMASAALDDAAEDFALVFEGFEVWCGVERGFYPIGYCESTQSG